MSMHASARTTVFIADSHPFMITGLRTLLQAAQLDVIGDACSAAQAIERMSTLKPDVAIFEIEMNGERVLNQIAARAPDVIVICLTRHEDAAHIQHALASGVRGYVLKRSEQKCLLDAIQATRQGDFYLDPGILDHFTLPAAQSDQMMGPKARQVAQLTERERDVLKYVALGFANKEVAAKLGVTPKSVETYKMRASTKLDIYSRSKIVQYAISQGWLQESTMAT